MSILAYGGQTTLIGLSIVFVALIILILAIYAMSWAMRTILGLGKNKAKKEAAPAPAPAPVQEAAPAAEEAPAADEGEYVTDPQIIAVIAAAIAAYDSNRTLVVRSVRRSSGWKKASRDEAVCRF